MKQKKILLTGFKDDLIKILSEFCMSPCEITLVSEKNKTIDITSIVDTIIYIITSDTYYSTQLHDVFVYVHDNISTSEEYLFPISTSNPNIKPFPEISKLPQISVKSLKEKLNIKIND